MPIQDIKLRPESKVAQHPIAIGVTTSTTATALPFFLWKPGYYFKFGGLGLGNRAEAGIVTIDARIVRGTDGILSNPNLRIDATEAEDWEADAFTFMLNGTVISKVATDGGDFTAAHVVTALKWGVILYQIAANGTISTKVPAATATTAMAFATEDEAVRSLPAPDANNVPVGYLIINADSGNWTANTDDLTDGGDLTTAEWVNAPFAYYDADLTVISPLSAAVAAVTGQYVEGTLSTSNSNLIGTEDDTIVLTFTTDGSGALTAGNALLRVRPYPLDGESVFGGTAA